MLSRHGLLPDPLTFAGVTALLLGVAVSATLKPAKKASNINPVDALRSE